MKMNKSKEKEAFESVLVGVYRCDSYNPDEIYKKIKKGLSDINFDFSKYKKKSRKKPLCLLKPNIIIPTKPESAVVTHPSIVEAAIRIFLEKGFRVVIGESDGSATTNQGLFESVIKEIADKYDVECIAFEDYKKKKLVKIKNEKNRVLKEFFVSEIIKEADIIVNLPKLKTHVLTMYTGAVKNMFGIIPGAIKSKYHGIAKTPEDFSNLLLDTYYTVKPQLNIMDGIVGMEGNGPSRGTPKNAGIILISENGVALDMVATKTIGFEDIVALNKIALSRENNDLKSKIRVVGDFEKAPLIKFEKPMHLNKRIFYFMQLNADKVLKKPFIDKNKCIKCLRCYSNCPVGAISIVEGYPKISPKHCIACYCCYEQCPANAVKLRKSTLTRSYEFLKKIFMKIRSPSFKKRRF
jgi:uncharacterized protein (DUF362 family)/NAD-dependent dihydropyrimidine dehydrogenase PreA subunit